ncbi:hypothetical protein QBK99_19600 [Corticibacterium sp. UT-5YL-CI-8]|nr:hypothetical protein [Tianweitania sp. UT-5YL-CI-8]
MAKPKAILVAAIKVNVPDLVVARTAIGDFQSMIRSKTARKLDERLEAAKNSLVGSFAGGVAKDRDVVRNAIISPWSNEQTRVDHTTEAHQRSDVRESKTRSAAGTIDRRIVGIACQHECV